MSKPRRKNLTTGQSAGYGDVAPSTVARRTQSGKLKGHRIQAGQMVEAFRPDLITPDLNLPGLGGLSPSADLKGCRKPSEGRAELMHRTRIMIVEDEALIADGVSNSLEGSGTSTAACASSPGWPGSTGRQDRGRERRRNQFSVIFKNKLHEGMESCRQES